MEKFEHFLNYDGDIIVEQSGSISPISMNGKFQLKNGKLIIKTHHFIPTCEFKYNSLSTTFNAFFKIEENGIEERFILEIIPYIHINEDNFFSTQRNPNLEKDEFEIETDDDFIELDKLLKTIYLKNKLEENLTENNFKTNRMKV
jgi:hypothetical protein